MFCNLSKEANWIRRKWSPFIDDLLHFFTSSLDNNMPLDYLFSKEDFVNYFIKYGSLYTPNTMKTFIESTHSGLLQNGYYRNYFCAHPELLLKCIDNCARLELPYDVLLDEFFIKAFCQKTNIFQFYSDLHKISRFVGDYPFLEEYKKFCDEEIMGIENGLLPSLKAEYANGSYNYREDDFRYDSIHAQLVKHICRRYGVDELPKDLYFKELSRYRLIGMIISNLFETEPYNLLIDIETLYEFATKHNHMLRGLDIYSFLLDYDNHSVEELLEFYERAKKINLKDMFYDDWVTEKEGMIREINESLLQLSDFPITTTADGISYRDITEFEGKILVSNTCVDIDNRNKLKELVQKVKTNDRGVIWLSLLDENHQTMYRNDEPLGQTSIKFLWGSLDTKRVGIVNHEDAYSLGLTLIDPRNNEIYKRRFYTVEEFMRATWRYNEITHAVSKNFLPIGILAEERITDSERWLAEELGISIYFKSYRIDKVESNNPFKRNLLYKQYSMLPNAKNLFEGNK